MWVLLPPDQSPGVPGFGAPTVSWEAGRDLQRGSRCPPAPPLLPGPLHGSAGVRAGGQQMSQDVECTSAGSQEAAKLALTPVSQSLTLRPEQVPLPLWASVSTDNDRIGLDQIFQTVFCRKLGSPKTLTGAVGRGFILWLRLFQKEPTLYPFRNILH